MRRRSSFRALLDTATLLAGLAGTAPSFAASGDPVDSPVPPLPSLGQVDQAARTLGSPLNTPVTGSSIQPVVIGGERPPSLEALQAARPGINPSAGLAGPRRVALAAAA